MVRKLNYLIERLYDMQKQEIISNNNLISWVKDNIPESEFYYTTEKKNADYAKKIISGKIELSEELYNDISYLIEDIRRYRKRVREYERDINLELQNYEVYTRWLRYLRGISIRSSAGLIAWIGNIKKFDKPSKLLAYAGLSAEHWKLECEKGHKLITTSYKGTCPAFVKGSGGRRDFCGMPIVKSEFYKGEPPEPKTGYIICVNQKLKTHIMKILGSEDYQSQDKCGFKKVLNDYRDYYSGKLPDTAKWIIMRKAYRATANLFVNHLWEVWAKLEGMAPVEPYVFGYLGHRDYIPPFVDLKDCPYCGELNDKDSGECKKCHEDISDADIPELL